MMMMIHQAVVSLSRFPPDIWGWPLRNQGRAGKWPYTVSQKKLGHFFTAYNFRNIEQIFTKFGTNQSLFILNIVPEFI